MSKSPILAKFQKSQHSILNILSFLDHKKCTIFQLLSSKFYRKYVPQILHEISVKIKKVENGDFENTLFWFCTG